MTEREYRLLEIDSYSSISAFLSDRKKYAKRYVYKESVEEENSYHLYFGSIVDCLLLTPEEFEDRFIITTCDVPTGQMFQFCTSLMIRTLEEEVKGTGSTSFEELLEKAYNDVKYDKDGNEVAFKRDSLDKVVARFEKEGKEYYEHLKKARNKQVISVSDYTLAEKVCEALKKSPSTRDVVDRQTNDKVTILNQLAIVFEYNGYEVKSLLDRVIIDHENKTINLYDLKTTYNVEEFENNYYKYKYYIQASLYWMALRSWAEKHGYIDKGYTVEYMKFIVCDSINYMSPLLYTTDEEHLSQALGGFFKEGKYYKGLNRAIEEMTWHKRHNIWNISYENFMNDGQVRIKLAGEV